MLHNVRQEFIYRLAFCQATNGAQFEPFELNGKVVKPSKDIPYLGVTIDSGLTFSEHVIRTCEKTKSLLKYLSSIMPNVNGPEAKKRKILRSSAQSIILYAAQIWHPALHIDRNRRRIQYIERLLALRVCSG